MQGHDGLHVNSWIVELHKRPTPGIGFGGGMCKTCFQYSTGKNIELRFGSECLGPEFCYRADQAIRRCSLARVSGAAEKASDFCCPKVG